MRVLQSRLDQIVNVVPKFLANSRRPLAGLTQLNHVWRQGLGRKERSRAECRSPMIKIENLYLEVAERVSHMPRKFVEVGPRVVDHLNFANPNILRINLKVIASSQRISEHSSVMADHMQRERYSEQQASNSSTSGLLMDRSVQIHLRHGRFVDHSRTAQGDERRQQRLPILPRRCVGWPEEAHPRNEYSSACEQTKSQ